MQWLLNPAVAMITFIIGICLSGLWHWERPQNSRDFQSGTIPTYKVQTNAESERYAVLSAVIKDIYVDDGVKLLVIEHQGRCPTPAQGEATDEKVQEIRHQMEEYAFKGLGELKRDTIDDFQSKANECHPLSSQLDIPIRYLLVTDKDLEPLFPEGEFDRGWTRFYAKYPASSGIISFSNVGFDLEMKQALVSTGRGCGGLCGAGYFVLLTKDKGLWKVQTKINTWVS
jgi:hypothetical protein